MTSAKSNVLTHRLKSRRTFYQPSNCQDMLWTRHVIKYAKRKSNGRHNKQVLVEYLHDTTWSPEELQNAT